MNSHSYNRGFFFFNKTASFLSHPCTEACIFPWSTQPSLYLIELMGILTEWPVSQPRKDSLCSWYLVHLMTFYTNSRLLRFHSAYRLRRRSPELKPDHLSNNLSSCTGITFWWTASLPQRCYGSSSLHSSVLNLKPFPLPVAPVRVLFQV